jgi:Domain of unknown function (DUF4160)
VPEISRLVGIVIATFYGDHLPPHFHTRYGEHRAIIEIESGTVLTGRLPPRVLGLVTEWATKHQRELRANWRLAREQAPLRPIPPLE